MQHVDIATESSSRGDIRQRLAGQFYTPAPICDLLASEVTKVQGHPRTVADPFCGDGRLISTWIRYARFHAPSSLDELSRVILWDYDRDAVEQARVNVERALEEAGVTGCRVDAQALDTLRNVCQGAGMIDLLLTNPPWELLKPDSRDQIELASARDFKAALASYADEIAKRLPGSSSERRKQMGGAHVNLARAGALACIELLSLGGVMGIVLPASIFGDQASAPFRREFFTAVRLRSMRYFPAELRAFTGVDQPFVTALCDRSGQTARFLLSRQYGVAHESEFMVAADLSGSEPVPLVVDSVQVELLKALEKRHPEVRMLECDMRFGLWMGRELDETRIADCFGEKGIPFLKGRQVDRFAIRPHTPPKIRPAARRIPATVEEQRFAWRDVSRPNQKRRVQATVIPRGWVTGNSLGVGFFRYGDRSHLLAFLGVLSSFVFELQLRAKLHTPHVSLGVIRACCIPWEVFEDRRMRNSIAKAVEACLASPDSHAAEADVERRVARAYGISKDDFAGLLKAFPKISTLECKLLLEGGGL